MLAFTVPMLHAMGGVEVPPTMRPETSPCRHPRSPSMLNRRTFFQRAAAGSVLFGLPLAQAERVFGQEPPALPPAKLLSSDPDRYWAELRRQWLLAADRINLNCGSVGCTPPPLLPR